MQIDVTESLILKAVQNARMMDAGRDYCAQGRVGPLSVGANGGTVMATVRGSEKRPYQVHITLTGGAGAHRRSPLER